MSKIINMTLAISLSLISVCGMYRGNETFAISNEISGISDMGDINNDNIVDAVDATNILMEYSVLSTSGKSTFDDEQKESADINKDGIIDSSDASCVLAYYSYTSTGGELAINVWYNEEQNTRVNDIYLTKYNVKIPVGGKDISYVVMLPSDAPNKDEIWTTSDENIATVDQWGNVTGVSEGNCVITVTSVDNPEVKADIKITVTDNSKIKQVNGITYVDGILIANKSYDLPSYYDPGMDSTTLKQFNLLSNAAAKEGLNIYMSSGYRSYSYQSLIYNNYVSWYGQIMADTFSARPGHSEHQTGLAIDVNTIDDSFANTPEAIWLENHAHEYGFIVRYPKGKENITGYKYEPWHIRYLGVETATAVYKSGLSLEEYLGIDSYYH